MNTTEKPSASLSTRTLSLGMPWIWRRFIGVSLAWREVSIKANE